MASRQVLRSRLAGWLATTEDDPEFHEDFLNSALQEAYDSLVEDIRLVNPDYLGVTVTLAAASSTSHQYLLASQAPRFAAWLSVRATNADGAPLVEARFDELLGSGLFAIIGPDESAELHTSPDTDAGIPLWFRYFKWPTLLDDDLDVPDGLPERFHDVVGLEALSTIFGAGGEQRMPQELKDRWQTRRFQLLSHCGRRGTGLSRTRFVEDD